MNLDANGQEPIPVSRKAQLKKSPMVDGWQRKNMIYEQLVDVFFLVNKCLRCWFLGVLVEEFERNFLLVDFLLVEAKTTKNLSCCGGK